MARRQIKSVPNDFTIYSASEFIIFINLFMCFFSSCYMYFIGSIIRIRKTYVNHLVKAKELSCIYHYSEVYYKLGAFTLNSYLDRCI